MRIPAALITQLVQSALAEDIGQGDITSALCVPADAVSTARISAREPGVIAGIPIAEAVFAAVDASVSFDPRVADGESAQAGSVLAVISGKSRSLLAGERVALNFLQRLSGVSTRTAQFVELVQGTRVRIIDTRKTTPGLRALEKYAVRVGGGANHRFGLDDGILIKDNHIVAAGGVGRAVRAAKAGAPHTLKVEVEVRTLDELKEAIDAGADALLLDNMDVDTMRRAVEVASQKVVLEASGGVNEANVAEIAATGIDLISVGALTHSVRALDIGMDFDQ